LSKARVGGEQCGGQNDASVKLQGTILNPLPRKNPELISRPVAKGELDAAKRGADLSVSTSSRDANTPENVLATGVTCDTTAAGLEKKLARRS
jgi:hypothetical protein